MVVALRVTVNVDDKQFKKALRIYAEKLAMSSRARVARGTSIADYALKLGTNPISSSITRQLKERASSDQEEFEKALRLIVEKEIRKASPTDNIIWSLYLEDIVSPIDNRLISRKHKVGTSDKLNDLQRKLSETVKDDFTLFIAADLFSQERRGEIPFPPNIKAIEIRTQVGKDLSTFKPTTQFISNLQFTILVRRQLEARMVKGSIVPRLPLPDPSRGLTFRSGKFVNTTEFAIDYRNRVIEYFIRPPYNVFLDSANPLITRYQPNIKNLTPAIRDIAKTVAAEQFNIVRSKSSLL